MQYDTVIFYTYCGQKAPFKFQLALNTIVEINMLTVERHTSALQHPGLVESSSFVNIVIWSLSTIFIVHYSFILCNQLPLAFDVASSHHDIQTRQIPFMCVLCVLLCVLQQIFFFNFALTHHSLLQNWLSIGYILSTLPNYPHSHYALITSTDDVTSHISATYRYSKAFISLPLTRLAHALLPALLYLESSHSQNVITTM